MNSDGIVQALTLAAIVGLVTDHLRIRSVLAGFVTHDRIERLEKKMDTEFTELGKELQRIARDLEFLRGRSGG